MSVDPQSSELGWQEIKRTQELIERCLQKYMRQVNSRIYPSRK